jgi:PKD repeat protein
MPPSSGKISYGAGSNQPPVAVASADKSYGPSPLTVRFSSAGSSDPEGQPLRYEWNFGDGTAVSTEANPSHTFSATTPTAFEVVLKVTDAEGLSTTTELTISVNNTPPTVAITSPAAGTKYPLSQNTVYELTANVTDQEHTASQLKYEWQTVLHHNTHTHPEAVDTARATSATITPVGCDGETYFYRINLKVTDAAGLSASTFVDLYPDCDSSPTRPVTISSPANNSSFEAGSQVELMVTFTDLARTWTKVEYLADTTVIGSSSAQPFSYTWQPATVGTYSITARATDNAAHTSISNPVTVHITGDSLPASSGRITREFWENVHGTGVGVVPVNTAPTGVSELTIFEAPVNVGTNYGQRIRGYVTAPATGQYTFWIAGDDVAELYLSTSEDPALKVRIASVPDWTYEREWTQSPSQQSAAISLEAGTRYYIEAVHLEGGGSDHLAVGWQLPDGTMERPIPGSRLSPYLVSGIAAASTQAVSGTQDEQLRQEVSAYPNPFRDELTLQLPQGMAAVQELALYDMAGRLVYRTNTVPAVAENKLHLDLSALNLNKGIYMLYCTYGQGRSSKIKLSRQ